MKPDINEVSRHILVVWPFAGRVRHYQRDIVRRNWAMNVSLMKLS